VDIQYGRQRQMEMEMSKEAIEEEKQMTAEKLLIHLRRINKSRLQKLALQ
jgi:hypothetical protein